MMTLRIDPETSPEQSGAVAAHELRAALAELGLLENVPECQAAVDGGRALVRLGNVDAATASRLAGHLSRAAEVLRPHEPTEN
jgi:hypothetical protein